MEEGYFLATTLGAPFIIAFPANLILGHSEANVFPLLSSPFHILKLKIVGIFSLVPYYVSYITTRYLLLKHLFLMNHFYEIENESKSLINNEMN